MTENLFELKSKSIPMIDFKISAVQVDSKEGKLFLIKSINLCEGNQPANLLLNGTYVHMLRFVLSHFLISSLYDESTL